MMKHLFNKEILLLLTGLILVNLILWNRLIRVRLPKELPLLLTDLSFSFLCFLCFVFVLTIIITIKLLWFKQQQTNNNENDSSNNNNSSDSNNSALVVFAAGAIGYGLISDFVYDKILDPLMNDIAQNPESYLTERSNKEEPFSQEELTSM